MSETNRYGLRPLSAIIEDVRETAKERAKNLVKSVLDNAEDTVRRIENTRQAIVLLDGEGFNLDLHDWSSGAGLTLELGFFPRSRAGNRHLAGVLRKVRLCLGCRLAQAGKDLANAKQKRITFLLRPEAFPYVSVRYERKLRPEIDAKCKIVTERSVYRRLVCEA